jgi:hypothetical protein
MHAVLRITVHHQLRLCEPQHSVQSSMAPVRASLPLLQGSHQKPQSQEKISSTNSLTSSLNVPCTEKLRSTFPMRDQDPPRRQNNIHLTLQSARPLLSLPSRGHSRNKSAVSIAYCICGEGGHSFPPTWHKKQVCYQIPELLKGGLTHNWMPAAGMQLHA